MRRSFAHIIAALALVTSTGVATGALADDHSARDPSKTKVAYGEPATESAPYRAHFGFADLYVPTFFHAVNGTYDLIVHFHGIPVLQEENIEKTPINAVVVSVTLGIGSGAYSDAYAGAASFASLLAKTQAKLDESGRAPGAHLGRLAITAWSAGFGAVGKILGQPENAEKIDAILLADGLHANYLGNHVINDAALAKYAAFAELAKKGHKLFALTHSAIQTEGYPSTTQTIGELLTLTNVDKTPEEGVVGVRGMKMLYQADRGSFHVKGYEGGGIHDHVDHIKGMYDTMYPYLQARWSRQASH
jgi:hypothetical protein